ncbi:hypothetical protein L7F22_032488 [Adiantum nelumboides]|nr:hypothetical protein [Adiantum nelumboides]
MSLRARCRSRTSWDRQDDQRSEVLGLEVLVLKLGPALHLSSYPAPLLGDNLHICLAILPPASINKDSDSSRTPSPPHYSRGGRVTFLLAESTSAPSQEFETSSYYEEEQILCWCVRCQGIYQRPRHQCRSYESKYGVFVDAPMPSQRHRPMAPAYDMEADVPLPSHMHGTSQMPDEYMRLLHKRDPKSYHKLKKQYEMDFDRAHEEYNDDNGMDDNDMEEFINDWYAGDDIVDWFHADYKGARATMRQECSVWSVDSSKPLQVTQEPYILLAHCEQAFFYATPDSNSPWRQVVPINPQGRQIFDTTYMEADRDSLHEDEPTSTKPLQLTTLAQEEPQEEAVDDNDAADDETEDLGMEFDFEPHHLEERPLIDVPPTLALAVHLTIEKLQETIQDNEEIELIIDLFSMND